MFISEEFSQNNKILLPRFGYTWITSLFIIVIVATLYSYTSISRNIYAFKHLKRGNIAFKAQNYEISIQNYIIGLEQAPSSKTLKIKAIIAIFKAKNPKYYKIAVDILSNLKFSEYESKALKRIMPKPYHKYLINKKN